MAAAVVAFHLAVLILAMNLSNGVPARKMMFLFSVFFVTVFVCEKRGAAQQNSAPVARPRIIRHFALNKFYETPEPLPSGKPGELIRSAEFDQYDLPGDVLAVRILYHSVSANNEDVPVSGVVLYPDKKAPNGGWPVIAWAHDLNGVARSCAPSLARNLRHGSFLSMYVQLGYAVVASDYAGLGSKARNAFADMNSNAADVMYSVAAARKAVPQLGARWIAMGTGEGAMAAVAVGERQEQIHDPSYLGSIAISGLRDLQEEYASIGDVRSRSLLNLVYGIQTVYPKFQPDEVLIPVGMTLYRRIAVACDSDTALSSATASALVKPHWQANSFVQMYFSRNRLGASAIRAPILVLSSDLDPDSPGTKAVVSRLCSAGAKIQFLRYPGSEPAALIGDSVRDQIQWMHDVFSNRTPHNDCPRP